MDWNLYEGVIAHIGMNRVFVVSVLYSTINLYRPPLPPHQLNEIYILAPPILNTTSCPQEKPMICKQLKI